MKLLELVEATDDLLSAHEVPHAFGGALAFGFHASPRSTIDVDVNVFLPFDRAPEVVAAFEDLGLRPERPLDQWVPIAGGRLVQVDQAAVVDLFFSVDEVYGSILRRCVRLPFGPDGRMLPVLSAEDLVVFKLSFGRAKDWVDLEALAHSRPDLDLETVDRTLLALRGATIYPRLTRFRALVAAAGLT